MYEDRNMRPVETIPGIGGGMIKENDGVGKFNYDILQEHFFIVYSFIHMYIHCLGHLSPFLPTLLFPPTHLTSRQNLFCSLLQYC
jgi:hypothetical protein